MDDDKTHAFAVSLFDFTLSNVTTHPPVFGYGFLLANIPLAGS